MYRIELEHGTTSGRRMIWVNGRVSGECTLQTGRLTPAHAHAPVPALPPVPVRMN